MKEIIYKIIELNQDSQSEFESIKEKLISINKNRFNTSNEKLLLQNYLSRKALLECLKKFSIEASFEDLELKNYGELVNFPDLRISLTHTKSAGAAIVGKGLQSVGVDLEETTRKIQDRTQKYYVNPEDSAKGLAPLEVWCIKEACFKSIYQLDSSIKSLPPIELREKIFCFKDLCGKWELTQNKGHYLALTTIE
jgi:phosphopantetheinyl transferase